ncbi:hypothetical protein OTU49_001911 [Cherax quadricarinatus]|uniref:NACHT domain-containing protein n=1 Tax=Cherax quadricarinatus TaxID=27406 RepID=A0AAW0XRA4_CHEQU
MDSWEFLREPASHLAIFLSTAVMQTGLPESRMPKGFSLEDFNFSKVYKCIHQVGQKAMCDVTRRMYLHSCVNSTGETVSVREYSKKVSCLSSTRQKTAFSKTVQPLPDKNIMEQEFDISFAYKLMTTVCCNIYNELDSNCQQNIANLKSLRNKISHKYLSNHLDITAEIDNLKKVLKEIYIGVGDTLQEDFTGNIEIMEKTLSDIYDAQIRQDDMITYEEDVKAFKMDRTLKLIAYGCKELKTLYGKLTVLNPCTWLSHDSSKTSLRKFQVDKIFTPLKIEDSDRKISISELLQASTRIDGEEKIPCALILYGLAGSGKTSLCRYILNNWCGIAEKIINTIENFDLVFLVEVRTVKSKTLTEYLTQQRLPKTHNEQFKDSFEIIPLLQELDILFVIDGFDEAGDEAKNIVEEIFAKFSNKRIILTTCPEYHTDAVLLSNRYDVDCLSIEVCGFDYVGLKEFTIKVFTAVEENEMNREIQIGEFLKYIRGRGKVLGSHLKLPLTLALLIYLWRDNPDILNRVTTATNLYCELFKLCQEKLEERLHAGLLTGAVQNVVLFLGKQAWFMLQLNNTRICISEDIKKKIIEKCEYEKIDDVEFMSAFLMCEIDENNEATESTYAFLHKTQMEYLAAGFLANTVIGGETLDSICNNTTEWWKYREVIVFLTGHLAINHILERNIGPLFTLIKKSETGIGNYNFWWKILTEALHHRKVADIIARELPLRRWELNDTHVVTGLQLLSNTPVDLQELKIEMPSNVEPYDIPELLDTMTNLRDKLRNRYDKNNPILVELHFWRHNEYNTKLSDDFIRTLRPWGHLTTFTGSLGNQKKGKEVLSYCFKLKIICVRIMTLEALRSLGNSLSRIYKSVNLLRVTLALPVYNCAPEKLSNLQISGDLEVTVPDIKDEDKEWLKGCVRQICGGKGCRHITLPNSQLTFSGIMWLLSALRDKGCEKLTIATVTDLSYPEMMMLKRKEKETCIEINWIH